MATTFLQTQKAHAPGRHQRSGQRADRRGYPDDGVPWGQEGWTSGVYVPPVVIPATGATEGTPGTWTPAGSTPPATLANLQAGVPNVVVASPATAWLTGYIQTANAETAIWSGTGWVALINLLNGSIDEVKAYVNGLADHDNRDDIIQALIDHERANKNRASLVTWLDQQTGVT